MTAPTRSSTILTHTEEEMPSGLLVIDKPSGWTSHDVVQKVKNLLRAKKVGHTGTLDPDATGVLVLCINQATRAAAQVTATRKTYRATIRFGTTTTTGDAGGQVTQSAPVPTLSSEQLEQALVPLRGSIEQRVPSYSAVKVKGKRLYRLARAGQQVERPVRTVTLYRLELESWSSPQLTLLVECSKGTYIRALAEDIGSELGLPAHLASLRRLAVGAYDLTAAISLEHLEQSLSGSGVDWGSLLLPVPL